MTDEENAAKARAQVAAMKNAQAAMSAVLEHNAKLTSSLKIACDALASAKQYISGEVYCWKSDGQAQQKVHSRIDAQVTEARKALG
jgi:hypothetical protein